MVEKKELAERKYRFLAGRYLQLNQGIHLIGAKKQKGFSGYYIRQLIGFEPYLIGRNTQENSI